EEPAPIPRVRNSCRAKVGRATHTFLSKASSPTMGRPVVLDDQTVKGLLQAYHEATRSEDGTPTPLMILHGLREEITIRPHIDLPSAYHMAHYLDEFVSERTIGITVCGRFFKQIGDKVFQGTLLYHIDRIGSHLIRGINAETGLYTVLDDSPY